MSNETTNQPEPSMRTGGRTRGGSVVGGVVMVVVGLLFLANNFIPGFHFEDYWPVILVVIGIGMLLKPRRGA